MSYPRELTRGIENSRDDGEEEEPMAVRPLGSRKDPAGNGPGVNLGVRRRRVNSCKAPAGYYARAHAGRIMKIAETATV